MPTNHEQPSLPGMERRDMLEAQGPAALMALKRDLLEKMSDIEAAVHEINDVLDGYGATDDVEYADHELNIVRGEN